MREIKFRYRFLNRKTKEVITTCLTIDQVENQGLNPNPFRGFDWHILSRDLYTGLKDKHGKEIYEGDILIKENCEGKVVVFWDINCFTIPRMSWLCEIIGNIYENPELVKSDG